MNYSETRRQLVHVAAAGAIVGLRYLDWRQAALLALAACAFNLFVLSTIAPQIVRAREHQDWSGIHFYPLAVLALILVFRDRLDLVAAAWAILAAGDGAATLAGKRWPGHKLSWNADKTWAGLAGFVIAGIPAAVIAGAWVASGISAAPDPGYTVWVAAIAAVVAALVETIPIGLDDNLSVPFAAAATLAFASSVDSVALVDAWPLLARRLPAAMAINAVLAAGALLARSLTLTGALVGAALGITIYGGAGGAGWIILASAFGLAIASSRVGHARKVALSIAEAHDGRRGAGNAWANCLVGAIGAALIVAQRDDRLGALMLVTGLAAGASDTVASEIGKAFGRAPRAILSLRVVPPGTPGAVSPAGTAAGIVAAAAMAWIASAVGVPGFSSEMIGVVVIGATAGALAESALASWLEPSGTLNNDVLNFLNTAIASAAAAWLYWR